ncbi:hydantoinase B/oxoprolinase family protein [Pseudonocardia sp. ICBG1293]|uniref:hydantoinase B/oxoprolinase family protein n=1 Tax=Pseudonocardia sp. ICBG1293 TaxID=2844382 RepID=UPI001CCC2376|nr:hydantoinase B/oxoprolinase family protein [Pseudonocardia sp. ICBG1293]
MSDLTAWTEQVVDDPVTIEIFSKALQNIAHEMGVVMMRASGSPVIAEAVDFSTFISDAEGDIVCYAGYITIYMGTARQAVKHILATTPRENIRPGDVFICNDPFTTGNAHQVDVGVVRPIFVGDEIVAWCWAEAHVNDFGGFAPGSMAPMATETYGEALRLPGVKIVSEGTIIDDIWRIIETNIRVPDMVLGDIRCFIAACNRCDDRINALVGEYGVETYRHYVEVAKDLAEQAVRDRIRELPDGVYSAVEYEEHNGHTNDLYPVACTLTVDDDHLTFDFTGSAPQTDGFVNCSAAITMGSAVSPALMTLFPDLPINQGTLRPLEVRTTPGTICDVTMPAPVSSGHLETGFRVSRVVTRLLGEAQAKAADPFIRDHVMASWQDSWCAGFFYAPDENGTLVPFPDMNGGSGGAGAQPVGDGMDVSGALAQPQNSLPDIEINEFAYPILYLWRRLNQNSGGPGRFRGGAGLDLAWTPWYTTGGQEHTMLSCWQVPPNGTSGGYPGTSSRFTLTHGAGVDRALAQGRIPASVDELDAPPQALQGKQFGMIVGPGDVVTLRSGGGGGYGDPLEREPGAVAADVRAGLLSVAAADMAYGVVVQDGAADATATTARRHAIRAERRSWPREGAHAVRRGPAAARLAELGQWCSPRDGVTVAEFADPDTGVLVRTEVVVAHGEG